MCDLLLRDLSWLSFNERVMQEAKDKTNHPYDRLRFLGIFSNNQDEFFRVRIAALNRMARMGKAAKMHLEENPIEILEAIQTKVIAQQKDFDQCYLQVINKLEDKRIYVKTETALSERQVQFCRRYFEEKIRTQIVPLMIESIPEMPLLRDKSIYLACVLSKDGDMGSQRFSLIEIPTKTLPRFLLLPSRKGSHDIILLEDIIRQNLSQIFSAFQYTRYEGYIIKVTRDAELDLDNDINSNIIEALTSSIKNRKKGKTTRFVYDRSIAPSLLSYLTKRLHLTSADNLIAGGRIHNFKDFMNFPSEVFKDLTPRPEPFSHPSLSQPRRIMEVLNHQDMMLHFPYHSFDSIIDLLREAAIDPHVHSIKLTCYRLSKNSQIINTLINAVRNGKKVTVIIELRARFDEEANISWKTQLEEEGVTVLLGPGDMKVHAKLCLIKKVFNNKTREYGVISTGNFNENTARYYGDHCLLTSRRKIIADIKRVFNYLEAPNKKLFPLYHCKTLPVSPLNIRTHFIKCIDHEIETAKKKQFAEIKIKLNSLVDRQLIEKLYEAAKAGVHVSLIIRGICCAITNHPSFKNPIKAISIIDEYLEHGRIFIFHNHGKPRVYISSADWMVRNLDHRIEVACPIYDKALKRELIDIFNLQAAENVKARILDNFQKNRYLKHKNNEKEVRSQVEIRNYLLLKQNGQPNQ